MTDEQYIAKARKEYQEDGSIEVDDGAPVSRGSDPGAYVQAWVWVYNETDPEVASEDEPDKPEVKTNAR